MDEHDCVMERRRPLTADPDIEIWHVARHRQRTVDFTPIRCSKDEGIVFPGPIVRRIPTCPDCTALTEEAPRG